MVWQREEEAGSVRDGERGLGGGPPRSSPTPTRMLRPENVRESRDD